MIAACITVAFVACVASFTALRLRGASVAIEAINAQRRHTDRIDERLSEIELSLDETRDMAQKARNSAAIKGR